MAKNGLFLLSLGFLIFVVGAIGGQSMRIEEPSLFIVALTFIIAGGVLFYRGSKRDKEKEEEAKRNESKKEEIGNDSK